MVTFKDYEYKRPNLEELKGVVRACIEQFKAAQTVEEQSEVIEKINAHPQCFCNTGQLSIYSCID